MAITSYLARVIYKTHTSSSKDFAGTYKLMLNAKSMPAPVSPPNNVETTGFEDGAQTFTKGIKQSDAKEVKGNLEKEYLENLDAIGEDQIDIMQLYGTDGIGGVAKYAYVAQVACTPDELGGVDEVAEMTATLIPNTVAELVTDAYVVKDNGDGTFTVTKKSTP